MKFKSIIKMVRNGSKVIVAIAFVFILTVSAVTLSAMASGSGDGDIQAELKALLGEAKEFGVFTENAFINCDFESNIATNNLTVGDTKDIGNSVGKYTNVAGTIFIKNFVLGTLQLRSANNIVLGDEYTDNGNNNITFGGGNILTANFKNVKIGVNANYVNITDTLSTIAKKLTQFEIDNTNGAVVDFTDKDKGNINILNCNEHICVVNIKMADYNRITKDKLKISKKDDQIIIINIIGNYSEFDLLRYAVNGVDSSQDNDVMADTVIFNFSDYSGSLHVSEVCGIIIATKANVEVASSSRGRVIAKSFCNPCGEWHFLAKDLEEETETESTTAPDTTKATEPESTTAPVTTKATEHESTTAPVTTKATEHESTTAPVTTKATEHESTTAPVTTKTTEHELTTAPVTTKATEHESTTAPVTTKTTEPELTTASVTTKATEPESTTVPVTTKATEPESTTAPTTTKATKSESTKTETTTKATEATTSVTDSTKKLSEVYADEDEVTKSIVTTKNPEVNADQDKVKTGDQNPIIIYFVAIGISTMIIFTFVILERKYKNKKREN